MKNKLVFVVGAYNHKTVDGNLEEYCRLELLAVSEEEAVKKAKALIKKSFYEVIQVIEVIKK